MTFLNRRKSDRENQVVLDTLQAQAWQEAKGKLWSLLEAMPQDTHILREAFRKKRDTIHEFIRKMEK